jgi:sugar lactone lactonase YvrE
MANRIRKINVSTRDPIHLVAYDDLPVGARIQSIEASADGTLYASDFDQSVVYKIHADGRVRVLAGILGTPGVVHSTGIGASTGLTAQFSDPIGMTVDASNNIYVGCAAGALIRRVSPSGRVRPFAGNSAMTGDAVGPNGGDLLLGSDPGNAGMGLCVDSAGILYVADTGNHKIKKIFQNGGSTVLAGGPGGAGASGFVNDVGNAARFNTPRDVAVDRHGNVYVADTSNNRIRKITPAGLVTTLAGATAPGSTDGNGLDARFTTPQRVAIDPSSQFLYVLETGADRIRRVDMHGNTTTFMTALGTPTGNGDITVDNSGFLYLLENDA